jgi:hypothetical protein
MASTSIPWFALDYPRFRNLADRSRARRRPRCFALLCGDSPATILFRRSDCWNIRFLEDDDEHEEDSSASEFRIIRGGTFRWAKRSPVPI